MKLTIRDGASGCCKLLCAVRGAVGFLDGVFKIFAAAAAIAMFGAAQADTWNDGTYTWVFTVNGDEAILENGVYAAIYPAPTGSVEIPATLGGKPVTAIGDNAFESCDAMTSVKIPNSVVSIGDDAFSGCYALTSAEIPSSVVSIGDYAFYDCYELASVPFLLLYNLTSIGDGAFAYCYALTEVELSDSPVTTIGSAAFSNCSSLKQVSLPNSLADIPDELFTHCTLLQSVTIPEGVTDVGGYAFSNCGNLESVWLPSTLTSVGAYAFGGTALDEVYVPAGSTDAVVALLESSNLDLTHVSVLGVGAVQTEIVDDIEWSYRTIGDEVEIYNDGYSAIDYSTSGYIDVPETLGGKPVTRIGDYAFDSCADLLGVYLPEGVKRIGYSAFMDCDSLENISLPERLARIGGSAFYGCDNLLAGYLPKSLERLEAYAFAECPSMKEVSISGNLEYIGECAFINCSSLELVDIEKGVEVIGANAFEGCASLEEVRIPESVVELEEYAFKDCIVLAYVEFEGSPAAIVADFAKVFDNTPFLDAISVNDDFDDSTAYDIGDDTEGVVFDLNIVATEEPNDPLPIANANFVRTKWFKWTAPDGVSSAVFYTYGSDIDTVLGVYTGGPAITALAPVDLAHPYDDDGCDGTSSRIKFPVAPGQVYYICVGGCVKPGSAVCGTICLRWLASGGFEPAVTEDGTLCGFAGDCPATVEVPDGVTRIGARAFSHDYDSSVHTLTTVIFPAGVTSIGDNAFRGCAGLVDVEFADMDIDVNVESAFAETPYLNSFNGNDNFANAMDLGNDAEGFVFDVNNTATVEVNDPLPALDPAYTGTKWYKWTAPDDVAHALFSTYGSEFDTVLGVYTGDAIDALTDVGVNDDGYDGCASRLSFAVTPGSIYYICVAGRNYASGGIKLRWAASDGFAFAVSEGGMLYGVVGDYGEEVEIPEYVVSICNSAFDAYAPYYEPTAANIKRLVIPASIEAIGDYAFRSCANLEFEGVVFEGPLTDVEVDMSKAFAYTPYLDHITKGDDFAAPVELDGASGTYCDCNAAATKEAGDPLPKIQLDYNGFSKWYCWTPAADTYAWFDTVGSDFDTVMGVYKGTSLSSLTEVAFSDDCADDIYASGTPFAAAAGTTYYICVAGYGDECGRIVLNWCTADDFALVIEDGLLLGFIGECPSKVEIPDTVTQIAGYVFSAEDSPSATNLEEITISTSVKSIGEYTFEDCVNLRSVGLAEGLESLAGWRVFAGCESLKRLELPASVTNVSAEAFYHMDTSIEVYMHYSLKDMLSSGDYGSTKLTTILYAKVAFDANGGTCDETPRTVTVGDAVGGLPEVMREGYELFGWFTAASGGKQVTKDTVVTADLVCYARWAKSFKVAFDANGGTCGEELRFVADGDVVGELPNATREGYELVGWFTAASGGEQVTKDTVVTADVNYYAQWKDAGGSGEGEGGGSGEGEGGGDVPPAPCYTKLEMSDIVDPYSAPSAVLLHGAVYDGCDVVGIVELKLGKEKKMASKISGSVTLLDGKKHSIKAVTVKLDGASPAVGYLQIKGLGIMHIAIGGDRFAGSLPYNGVDLHVQSASACEKWSGASATASVDMDDVSVFPGMVLTDLLPYSEAADVVNGKWKFRKAAGVKWGKPKAGTELSELYDPQTGKDLLVNVAKGKTNLSGMKLSYTPKKGTFKGSFKLFTLQGEGKGRKLKKYTVKVSGVVVNGVGYGIATCKRPAGGPWAVTVTK